MITKIRFKTAANGVKKNMVEALVLQQQFVRPLEEDMVEKAVFVLIS